jgi:hypothetical protein
LLVDQLKVADWPLSTLLEELVKVTVGTGSGSGSGMAVTETETAAEAPPPGPVQESVNVASPDRGPTLSLPLVLLMPDQPPLALQLSASVADQLRLVEPALATLLSAALNDSVGGGSGGVESDAGNTMTIKVCSVGRTCFDADVHFRVNDWGVSIGPVRYVPWVGIFPLQAPVALQNFAFAVAQLSKAESPCRYSG